MRYAVLGSPRWNAGLLWDLNKIVDVDVILSCDGAFIGDVYRDKLLEKPLPTPVITIPGSVGDHKWWNFLTSKVELVYNLYPLANGIIMPVDDDIVAGVGGVYRDEHYVESKANPIAYHSPNFLFNFMDVGNIRSYGAQNVIDFLLMYQPPELGCVRGNEYLGGMAFATKTRFACFNTNTNNFILNRVDKAEKICTWVIGLPISMAGFCTIEPDIPRVIFFRYLDGNWAISYMRHL